MGWIGILHSRASSSLGRLVVAAAGIALGAMPATAQRAIPDAEVRSGTLSFDGHATVGDFVGTTSTVTGHLTGAATLDSVRGWVEAPVKTLVTANDRRDRDLNKSMESDKHPTIRFDLTGVRPTTDWGDSAAVVLVGKLTVHGVVRDLEPAATVHFQPDGIRLRTDFPLNLKDFEIGGLSKFLGVLKMHEDIEVHVDVLFGAISEQ